VAEALHRRLKRAWRGERAPLLQVASHLYGSCADGRNLLYEAGIFRTARAPIAVVSVGGLTAGGSGKTPLAADIAVRLSRRGKEVALIGPGEADELLVHQHLCAGALVLGGRNRRSLALRAAQAGVNVVVLDGGFQHRRLGRDLDLVAVDVETLVRARWRRLPAGPFRDRLGELRRADAIVTVRRRASLDAAAAVARHLAAHFPAARHASCRLEAGAPVSFNDASAGVAPPRPMIAIAGIMYPEHFFAHVREHLPTVSAFQPFPDHARFPISLVDRWCRQAGSRGLVCTLKDAVKLEPALRNRVPLWYVPEKVMWESGATAMLAMLAAVGS